MNYIKHHIKHILLILVILLGFALRIAGYDWGGHSIYQPDESKMVEPVIEMAARHSLLSYNYLYPDQFLSKVQAAALVAYDRLTGIGLGETVQAYWICRIITILCGTATILFVYLIGERLRPGVGILSALIFAVSPYMVIMCKQVTGDIGALFGSVFTMYFALEYSRECKYRYIVLMALGSAISMLEKWHGGGGVVFIALIILLYVKSFKDLVIRGSVALLSFIGWIFVIAPNVLMNIREVYVEGFLNMANHDGESAKYTSLLGDYLEWGFLHIGGAVYLLAVLAGIVIMIIRREKKYAVISFGLVKTLEMCFLNRAVWRWDLELYLSEIICIAVFVEWLFVKEKIYYRVAAGLIGIIVFADCLSASAVIDLVAVRKDQDVRAMQEKYCDENGITIENTVSSYYSAFQPAGYRTEGLSEKAEKDWSNVLGYENGELVRYTDKDFFVWTDYMGNNDDIIEKMNSEGLCIWSAEKKYNSIFFNPIWNIDHSWNDLFMIRNNLMAFSEVQDGALSGKFDIRIYEISSLQKKEH